MARRKRYSVQRRIDVWVETEILAHSFDDAVEQAKEMTADDFIQSVDGATILDTTLTGGLAVIEQ